MVLFASYMNRVAVVSVVALQLQLVHCRVLWWWCSCAVSVVVVQLCCFCDVLWWFCGMRGDPACAVVVLQLQVTLWCYMLWWWCSYGAYHELGCGDSVVLSHAVVVQLWRSCVLWWWCSCGWRCGAIACCGGGAAMVHIMSWAVLSYAVVVVQLWRSCGGGAHAAMMILWCVVVVVQLC